MTEETPQPKPEGTYNPPMSGFECHWPHLRAERSRPTSQEQITTLFETTGVDRISRIEPVGTPRGRVAIGIFPGNLLTWNGNFFILHGAVLDNANENLTVATLYAAGDGGLGKRTESMLYIATAKVRDEIEDVEGLDVYPPQSDERRKELIMMKEGLHQLAEAGSAYDPAKSAEPRDILLKILAKGRELGHPAILEAAKGIVSL